MGRWEPDARGRLEAAAMALYSEQGFEETTVAEIAQRAGLTERTFFRHFADKREVLFGGERAFREAFLSALDRAPASLGPLDAIGNALETIAEAMQPRRDFATKRQAIIAANPDLQERERIKLAALATALAEALRRRGAREDAAVLAAEMGVAVFRIAFQRWVDNANKSGFTKIVRTSLEQLRAVASG